MKNTKKIWISWAIMYGLCTVCAFFPVSSGLMTALFLLLSLGFFVPPGILVFRAIQGKNPKILKTVRNLSLISLSVTLVTILLNFVAFSAEKAWGVALYWILILVSTPMICAQIWVVSLFCWACLLMVCLKFLKRK